MKIVTVVGARPQFIKAAAVSRVVRDEYAREIEEILVHTGQHFDANMSQSFFDVLDIPQPKYNLEIAGGNHGQMTGRMLEALEKVMLDEKPDWVLIYGDTNSTLAGALAAVKLHLPVAHVEAGLRSFNLRMPEEVNRIVADRVSSMLFCPTETAIKNLNAEGIVDGVHKVGDVMFDVSLHYARQAREESTILSDLGLTAGGFALATCHRAENTDDPRRLEEIVAGLAEASTRMPVVFPLHPRARKLAEARGLSSRFEAPLIVTEPLGFLDMVALEQAARVILTDSGGVQKEAYFYNVPCITMRDETEWVETVELGANRLVGASRAAMIAAVDDVLKNGSKTFSASPYGQGRAAAEIVNHLYRLQISK